MKARYRRDVPAPRAPFFLDRGERLFNIRFGPEWGPVQATVIATDAQSALDLFTNARMGFVYGKSEWSKDPDHEHTQRVIAREHEGKRTFMGFVEEVRPR